MGPGFQHATVHQRGSVGRKVRIFIAAYAGSARLSKKMHARGYHVLAWDVLYGPDCDITKSKNQKLIRGWILSKTIICFHAGFPCSTWSRIRGVGYGPPALRDKEHLLGLPNMDERYQEQIEVCNITMTFTVSCLVTCDRIGTPATAENPKTSLAWDAPAMLRLRRSPRFQEVDTCFCQWGEPWRKATRFLGCNIELTPIARMCHQKSGLCSRTGKPHVQLRGAVNGVWLTSVAEPYPWTLCKFLASCFEEGICQRRINNMSRLLAR